MTARSKFRLLFLHGSGTNPLDSNKVNRLRAAGHEVGVCPALAYPSGRALLGSAVWFGGEHPWFDRCVQVAQEAFDRFGPDVVVGSSMGGAVALNLRSADTPLVLVAPAWKVFGVFSFGSATGVGPLSAVVHGSRDWLVWPSSSLRLLQGSPPLSANAAALTGEVECRLDMAFGGDTRLAVEGRLIHVVGDGQDVRMWEGKLASCLRHHQPGPRPAAGLGDVPEPSRPPSHLCRPLPRIPSPSPPTPPRKRNVCRTSNAESGRQQR